MLLAFGLFGAVAVGFVLGFIAGGWCQEQVIKAYVGRSSPREIDGNLYYIVAEEKYLEMKARR